MTARALVPTTLLLASLAALSACSTSDMPIAPDADQERLTVSNDAPEFADRVQYTTGDTVQLTADTSASGANARVRASLNASVGRPPSATTFLRSAVVSAPRVNGSALLASHVVVRGSFAYVSYMTLGEVARGAVEVFDISTPDRPRLVSQAILSTSDVLALAVSDSHIYLATSSEDPTYKERAVLERIALQGGRLSTTTTRVQLPSYVATGVDVSSKWVYVTSGNGGPGVGGLTILDRNTLARVSGDVFADARAVTGASGKYVAVSQGGPARLRLYNAATGALTSTVSLQGGTIPDSKSSVALTDTWGFVATGDGGVQVVDLSGGIVRGIVPRPNVPGVSSADAVTNAVSLSGDFILAADGGAGVAVTWSDHRGVGSGQRPTLVPLGRLLLPGSANYIASDNNAMFVAQGSAGLQVLSVKTP